MQVFVYEYFTGGGARDLPQEPSAAGLFLEAAAMLKAVTEDFTAIASVDVISTLDARLPRLHPAGCQVVNVETDRSDLDVIARLSGESDWTLLIAPETRGKLLERA